MPGTHTPLAERFWQHVDLNGPVVRPGLGNCWNYLTNGESKARGLIRVNGIQTIATRVSWEFAYGRIPGSLQVLHECDNPVCVRPAHLFLGSAADNMTDKQIKGRALRVATPDQRGEIERLAQEGRMTYAEIATRFGISQSSAFYIGNGLRTAKSRMDSKRHRSGPVDLIHPAAEAAQPAEVA